MDKNSLKESQVKRQETALIPELLAYEKCTDLEKSEIILRNGSRIFLSPQDISKGIDTISQIAKGILEIKTIREQGELAVKMIHTEILRINVESEKEIQKMETEGKIWNEKFDRKIQLFLTTIDKIENSRMLTDDLKKVILDNLGLLLNEK
jgi:hypothetical protein